MERLTKWLQTFVKKETATLVDVPSEGEVGLEALLAR